MIPTISNSYLYYSHSSHFFLHEMVLIHIYFPCLIASFLLHLIESLNLWIKHRNGSFCIPPFDSYSILCIKIAFLIPVTWIIQLFFSLFMMCVCKTTHDNPNYWLLKLFINLKFWWNSYSLNPGFFYDGLKIDLFRCSNISPLFYSSVITSVTLSIIVK